MLRFTIIIFCILFFSIKNVHSKDSLYFFGGLGISNYNIGNSDIDEVNNKLTGLGFATSSTSFQTDNLSYEYGIGTGLLALMNLELSYLSLGQLTSDSSTTSPSESLKAKVNIQGLNFDLVKNFGPFGISGGLIKIDDKVSISSSLGNIDLPIDDYFLPKIGIGVMLKRYRIEANRAYLTQNSSLNYFMISYVFDVF